MPIATSDPLAKYIGTLIPDEFDRQTVASRKSQIIDCLNEAGVNVIIGVEAGSFSHGTGIKDHFDIDQMIWIGHEQQTTLPSSTLTKLKNAIYPMSSVRSAVVSSPTVRVEFWSPPHVEVVPAFFDSERDDFYVYEIPGRSDEWVKSAPAAHNRYVNTQNDRLDKKVKQLVRLVKSWNYGHDLGLSSFYLEMRVAEYCVGEQSILYYWDLPAIFRRLVSTEFRDMNDPSGITGRIPSCSSTAKRLTAVVYAELAISQLADAERHRERNDTWNYYTEMCKVFPDFPYGVCQ